MISLFKELFFRQMTLICFNYYMKKSGYAETVDRTIFGNLHFLEKNGGAVNIPIDWRFLV